jgi:predicted TIM-barrel fold metal-dependent hydrolase
MVKIVDFHSHAPERDFLAFLGGYSKPTLDYFKKREEREELKEYLDRIESEGIKVSVILCIDKTIWGSSFCPDIRDSRVVKFFSLNPIGGGIREKLREALNSGFLGLKLHPELQAFDPLDRRAYRVYELAQENELPIVFHTGYSGIGTGIKGGGGVGLRFGSPLPFDEIALDFPDLKILLAHFGWPWLEEAVSIAMHKPNVFLDISGWSPKRIPSRFWELLPLIKDKVLFGSDYPLIDSIRVIRELREVAKEWADKILYYNYTNFLKI